VPPLGFQWNTIEHPTPQINEKLLEISEITLLLLIY